MATIKIYNNFTDKFGNEYSFDNFIDFASFWFGMSRKSAIIYFPNNFAVLQKAAANSKEAMTRIQYITTHPGDGINRRNNNKNRSLTYCTKTASISD